MTKKVFIFTILSFLYLAKQIVLVFLVEVLRCLLMKIMVIQLTACCEYYIETLFLKSANIPRS